MSKLEEMKYQTTIINLFGGGGTGKSTNAAMLFGTMKQQGILAEQVTEYVKEWAWEDRKPGEFDQFYIAAKQARKEYRLFGKVQYIITDSPVLLSAFYEEKYYKFHITRPSIDEYLKAKESLGIKSLNYFIKRNKPYIKAGRYQTEDEARQIDVEMRDWLLKNKYEFTEINGYEDILENLGINIGKTNWKQLELMTEEDINKAALNDPDAQPLTEAQLSQFKRVIPPATGIIQ